MENVSNKIIGSLKIKILEFKTVTFSVVFVECVPDLGPVKARTLTNLTAKN
jgi:hypothetical protein